MQLRRLSVMVASSKCQKKNEQDSCTWTVLSLCALSCQLAVVQGHEACLCLMKTVFFKLL